jgi:serine/threonine protein kinase
MNKGKFKKGQRFGKWKLIKFIGAGGNGEVWRASSSEDSSSLVAIKLLRRIDSEGYARFKDEVKVLRENHDIEGLLPILDDYLPENQKGEVPWYAMPLATPLIESVKGMLPDEIVEVVISVSETLTELHERGISHRDIKPANILVKDRVFCLSDFGLVEYPTKADITLQRKDLGPKWTIAPEMKRNPHTADGKLADVYSMAKTMWILLTKEEKGFEGQYSSGSSIEIKKLVPSIYHAPIEDLLHKSTDHNPENRPSIKEFVAQLIKWKELNEDFARRSKSEWSDIQRKLFPSAMPRRVVWENIDDIVAILNIIGDHNQVNHTLFPMGGGLDLEGANSSYEKACIELRFNGGGVFIVKPQLLAFESFQGHFDWNYFRLETEGLKLIGKSKLLRDDEVLTELQPCVYTNPDCYKFDDFNGQRLPASARIVTRLAKGSFLICVKTGTYNSIRGTYDGTHDKLSADDFRELMEQLIASSERKAKATAKMDKTGTRFFKKPIFEKSTKIRKSSRFLTAIEIRMIKTVISLSKAVEKEYKRLRSESGLPKEGPIRFSAWREIEAAPKPKREEFNKYLESCSDDELAIIEAVMYGGIDAWPTGRAYPLDEMLESLRNYTRQSRLDGITRKASARFFAAGIKAYK